jgi:hypothetical protein
VDRFSKEAHFIPCRRDLTAKQLADIFLSNVYRIHGLPSTIISDRDKLFTSNFWNEFTQLLGIKPKLSTAFHPETDGQAERTNGIIEQYLRMNVNYLQDDWEELLPLGEVAYNNSVQRSTGFSPWFINKGFHPRTPASFRATEDMKSVELEERTKRWENIQNQVRENLEAAQEDQKELADKKRREVKQEDYEVGKLVWLNSKNVRTSRPSKKLDDKNLGPFKIVEKRSDVVVRLELPKTMKIHPVFHVKLLKPFEEIERVKREQKIPKPVVIEGEEEWEIEKIVKTRKRGKKIEFEIKWKGCGEEENTWEPLENLRNSLETIEFFFKKHPNAKGKEEFETFRRTLVREGGSVRNEEELNYVSVEKGDKRYVEDPEETPGR